MSRSKRRMQPAKQRRYDEFSSDCKVRRARAEKDMGKLSRENLLGAIFASRGTVISNALAKA